MTLWAPMVARASALQPARASSPAAHYLPSNPSVAQWVLLQQVVSLPAVVDPAISFPAVFFQLLSLSHRLGLGRISLKLPQTRAFMMRLPVPHYTLESHQSLLWLFPSDQCVQCWCCIAPAVHNMLCGRRPNDVY